MLNSYLNKVISTEAQEFIKLNENLSSHEILLKYSGKTNLYLKEISEHIESSKKAFKKIPNLAKGNLIYRKIPLEQASSEFTAFYKSKNINGNRIIDLTGGLGIDSIFFSKQFEEVYYCEMNNELAEIAEYNFSKLGIKNIKVISGDSIETLAGFEDIFFDWIYADPSRRSNENRSVDINFYSPDIISNINLLFSKSKNILLKLAPAFDLTEAIKIFPNLCEFSILSFANECKEVLLFLSKNEKVKIKSAVLLDNKFGSISISDNINKVYKPKLIIPEKNNYFYEPDSAIRKANLTDSIANKLELCKINNLADYLLSKESIVDFPGRAFQIIHTDFYNEKRLKKYLADNEITKANISRSNFPIKPEEIKKILKLKDGGDNYLFFTKDKNDKLVFISTLKTSE